MATSFVSRALHVVKETNIFVSDCAVKGRGIFAQIKISKGETIEESPVIILPPADVKLLEQTALKDYYFLWGEDEEQAAVLLGLCSICNHSYNPNAVFNLKVEQKTIEFVALRDIQAGEEITINYNGNPANQTPVWFDALP